MLAIRLSRIGRKNKPYYKLVIQEKARAPKSKAIEIVGTFDPHQDPAKINLKEERIQYWLSQGAQPSNTVHNMLVNAGIIKGDKKRVVAQFKKKKKKGEEDKTIDSTKTEKNSNDKTTANEKEGKSEKSEKKKT